MVDKLDKIIKGIEMHASGRCQVLTANGKEYCPYWENDDNCMIALLKDTIFLLKAQDEVIQGLRKVGYPHDFQREEPWIVNYMNAITDVIKKAVRLNNG